jgi:hypothetical protein
MVGVNLVLGYKLSEDDIKNLFEEFTDKYSEFKEYEFEEVVNEFLKKKMRKIFSELGIGEYCEDNEPKFYSLLDGCRFCT